MLHTEKTGVIKYNEAQRTHCTKQIQHLFDKLLM